MSLQLENVFIEKPKKFQGSMTLIHGETPKISLRSMQGNKQIEINLKDIAGCACMMGKKRDDIAAYLVIYSYPLDSKTIRHRSEIQLRYNFLNNFDDNFEAIAKWRGTILSSIHSLTGSFPYHSNRKLLILVNPHGGQGRGRRYLQERVMPILSEAECPLQIIVTERANHAEELMKEINPSDYACIVIVSGDGLAYEVINGLMSRPDWEQAIKTPIGMIPAGSGNALAASVLHSRYEPFRGSRENLIRHCSFILARPNEQPMDLIAVETAKRRVYGFMGITWGLVGDVDIESEKYRFMGAVRFTVGAVQRILKLRTYRGRLFYLPFDDDDNDEDDESAGASSAFVEGASAAGSSSTLLVSLDQPVPSNWIMADATNFITFMAYTISHLSTDFLAKADCHKIAEGFLQIAYVTDAVTKGDLLKILLGTEDGTFLQHPSVTVVRAKAFRLEPDMAMADVGHIVVDGEQIDYGPVQAELLPSIARIWA